MKVKMGEKNIHSYWLK